MAALRRTTRQKATCPSSTAELHQKRRSRRRNRSRSAPVSKKDSETGKDMKVEVIDLCGDSSDGDEDGGDIPPPPEEEGNSEPAVEEEKNEIPEFKTFFDFESDDSLANLTVKSFFRDCFIQPKIFCHQRFRKLRIFIEEATGIKFTLPKDAPFPMDHEDDTFCVDKGDKWLVQLKKRLLQNNQNRNSSVHKDSKEETDDENGPTYYWATITPVQRKSYLGLIIFRWIPLKTSLSLLDIYLTFCRSKYVSPAPRPSPSGQARTRRHIRASLRSYSCVEEEEEEVLSSEPEEIKVDHEENGLDDYIKDFIISFQLTRNIEVEERLLGDLEARSRRSLENKEEPQYSCEPSLLIRQNHLYNNTPVRSRKCQPVTNGRLDSDTESESSSVSSKESECSEYKVKYRVAVGREAYKNRKTTTKEPTVPTKAPVVTNGPAMMNGTIRSNSSRSSSSTNRSEDGSSSLSSKSYSGKAALSSPVKRQVKLTCDVCRPPKEFATLKSLYRHLTSLHGSRKRELITCECGIRIRKERLSFHKKFCRKTIMSSNGGAGVSPLTNSTTESTTSVVTAAS